MDVGSGGDGMAVTMAAGATSATLDVSVKNNPLGPPADAALSCQTLAEWLNRTRSTPVINKCLMAKENMDEAMDVILGAVEKHPWDNRQISQDIKRNLDDRLGATWHVIVGEAFSFEIAFESDNLLYLFYGSLGIIVWKCGTILMSEMKYKKNRLLYVEQ